MRMRLIFSILTPKNVRENFNARLLGNAFLVSSSGENEKDFLILISSYSHVRISGWPKQKNKPTPMAAWDVTPRRGFSAKRLGFFWDAPALTGKMRTSKNHPLSAKRQELKVRDTIENTGEIERGEAKNRR